MTVSHTVPIPEPEREPGYDERHFTARHAEMFGVVDETVIAPPAPLVHYDTDTVALVTGCGQRLGDLPSGEDVSTDPARVTCPECLPRPAPVVHYDTDNIELTAACGVPLGSLRHDSYSTDPAAVDCPPCSATLVDGQLAEPTPVVHYDPGAPNWEGLTACYQPVGDLVEGHDASSDPAKVTCPSCAAAVQPGLTEAELAAPERTDWAHMPDDELEDRLRGSLAAAEHEGFADLAPQIGPAPAVDRTVSVEPLTAELREAANAAIAAEYRKHDREPELLPPEARAAVVVRAAGQLESVTDVETDVPQRNGAEALAWLMHQAQGRANNLDAELLMPTPDVLAALEGRPVGNYTASIPLRYGDVRPGWQVLTEVDHGNHRDFVWQLVEGAHDCERPKDCPIAGGDEGYCVVVTVRGRGVQHMEQWRPVHVRIPANSEVKA